jgi:hypothetical protein
MNKVVEYSIVSNTDHIELAAKVNELIAAGFQPLGGLCAGGGFAKDEPIHTFQAMVKYADATKKDHG